MSYNFENGTTKMLRVPKEVGKILMIQVVTWEFLKGERTIIQLNQFV